MPGQSFGCISNGHFGLTLINFGNIGYYRDEKRGARLSLILASGADQYRYGPYPLSGKAKFRYSVVPHSGTWAHAGSVLRALETRTPVRSSLLYGNVPASSDASLIHISNERVLATALFEHKGKTFLRMWNSLGEEVPTDLAFNIPVQGVCETNIFGQDPKAVGRTQGSFRLEFTPFELKTLLLS